ncbi:MAG TPA: hypothetical protein VKJ45_04240 [Blastocatellia bacterium]|nr:hypothetical protein [Blastocatellia bacterium]
MSFPNFLTERFSNRGICTMFGRSDILAGQYYRTGGPEYLGRDKSTLEACDPRNSPVVLSHRRPGMPRHR